MTGLVSVASAPTAWARRAASSRLVGSPADSAMRVSVALLPSMTDLLEEGNFSFWFGHADNDWPSNGHAYDFGVVAHHDAGVQTTIKKTPDGKLHVALIVKGRSFSHEHDVSSLSTRPSPNGSLPHATMLLVQWNPKVVELYLGSQLAASFPV